MTRQSLPAIGLVSALAMTLLSGPEARATEIPLESTRHGGIVEVHVNGKGPFRLVVSTGGEYTFLSEQIFEELGLDGEAGKSPVRLKLGGRRFDLEVHAIPGGFLPRGDRAPDGFLGWGALRDHVWTIDFPREQLRLEEKGTRLEVGEDVLVMDLRDSAGFLDAGKVPFIGIRIGGTALDAEISSSAEAGLMLPAPLADDLSLKRPPETIGMAQTPDGRFPLQGASLVEGLRIGREEVAVPRTRFSDVYPGPALGYEVLRDFALTFDFRNKRLRFVRPAGVVDPQQIRAAQVIEVGGEATLRDAFNADRGKVRLLLILSPTCPGCITGALEVSKNVLARLSGADLAVHVVWTPVLPPDNEQEAIEAHHLVADPRARFFWDPDRDLGMSYGRAIELPRGRQLAWDIYFAFGPEAEWQETIPMPFEWSHQLGHDERRLGDGTHLRSAIETLLATMKKNAAAAESCLSTEAVQEHAAR